MRNILKLTLVVALAIGLTVAFAPKAKAFHDNGVAHCNGCHTMHNSYEGASVIDSGTVGQGVSGKLLIATKPSEVCLSCHGPDRVSGYDVLSASSLTPHQKGIGAGGGDFVFLKISGATEGLNDGHGSANSVDPDRAGHNIDAPAFGLNVQTTPSQAPGGTFNADQLGCTSCHDPHGGPQFRLLKYSGAKDPGVFTSGAIEVWGEISASGTESQDAHNVYKANVSAWCGECHGDFHAKHGNHIHPSGENLGGSEANIYNRYDGTVAGLSSDPNVGPYLALVPVQFNAAPATLSEPDPNDPNATIDTPPTQYSDYDVSASDKVMCLTCHRAHASSGPSSGRWDFNITEWLEEGSNTSAYLVTIDNPYAAQDSHGYQRSLCNKCHAKDMSYDVSFNTLWTDAD